MTVVSGQVLDYGGQGMPSVVVYATRVGGRRFSPSPTTVTDLSGRWGLDLAAGSWNIREVGFASHTITVGEVPIQLGEPVTETQVAEEPSYEDIERLLARRQASIERDIRDERDVNAPPSETRPLVESPIGDVTAFLRERRNE